MANRRDLHIDIDGDARGFDAACDEAEGKARGLDSELAKLERQQAAQEKVTTRTTAAVQKYAATQDKAALAARRMGLEVKRAAEQAQKAEVRAAAAAEAAAKGLFDKEKAAKLAARADDAVERAALKAAEAQLAEAAAAEKAANAERKAADAGDKHKASTVGMTGVLVSAGAAAAALAAPLGAAGLAAIGFAAVAAPSIKKVITAQTDLVTKWDTLDKGQKVAASSVHSLVGEYKDLAKSYEPDALKVFNGAVATSRQLLPQLGKTVDATKGSVADFATSLENTLGKQLPRLFTLAQTQGPQALNALGTTFDQTAQLAVGLVHDLAPMGMTLLNTANGGLRLLNMVEQINPHLVEFGVTALALRAPTQALGGLWTKNASKLSGLAKEGSKAEGLLGKLGKTVGNSPNLYIGAALAVGYVVARMATMKDSTDNLITSLRTENSAIGNNIVGHQGMANSLSKYIVAAQNAKAATMAEADARAHPAAALSKYNSEIGRLTEARKAELTAVKNINAGETNLASTYSITTDQANQLATAAGVDLSKGITGSGDAAKAAQAKVRAYYAAVQQATDPTFQVSQALSQASNNALDLKTRMTALSNAFGVLAGPELAAFDATTKTAGAFDQFDAAMKKSKGSMSLQTAAGQNSRSAFAALLSTVQENTTAQYAYDSATKGAAVAAKNRTESARQMLPVLLAEAGANKTARNAILDWATSAGVGKTRTEAMSSALGLSRDAFLRSAQGAGKSRAEALKLWAAFNKLPKVKDTRLSNNAKSQRQAVQDYQNKINNLRGKTVNIYTVMHLTETQAYANKRSNFNLKSHGGPINGYARGGNVARMADGGPSGPVVGPGSGTSDDVPVWLSNGEYVIRATQARKHKALLGSINAGTQGFASGGVLGYASGGAPSANPLALSDVLQHWQDVKSPASAADVSKAAKARRTQVDQLKNAEDALYRARRRHNPRAVAAAERRIRKERDDLAAATAHLHDVEARHKFGKLSPAARLNAALSLGIKDNATFIKNLQKLADRGAGDLANKLLAMGGPQAEKIAASAVKLNTSKLGSIEKKIGQEQGQTDYMANLPNILTVRSTLKGTKGGISSWVALLDATGLDAGSLSDAVKLMTSDLSKTASGKALIADMHAHGYARGGSIVGPPGTDRVPMWGTAGEYVIRKEPAAANRQLLDAINQGIRVPVPASPVMSGASGGASGPAQVTQHNVFQTQDPHVVARESAREMAWMMRG